MRPSLVGLVAGALAVGLWACSESPPHFPDLDSGAPLVDGGSDAGGLPAKVGDAGSADAGVSDGGTADAGPADAGVADSGEPDAGGAVDAGPLADGGPNATDAGPAVPDAGLAPDAGVLVDAGAVDAGPPGLFPVEGFGRTTRGGWQSGGDEVCVASLADSGPGTLREALGTASGPRVIRFCLDGTITLTSALLVPSNVSIDGRGRTVTLAGRGLILAGTDDVIVTHLTIEDVLSTADDGIRIGDPTGGASERVVVDHVTLRANGTNGDSAKTDEAVSVIFGSRDVTLQWVRVENWEKFILIGNGDAPQSVDAAITVSLHHVWASQTGRRHPQARYGIVDVWNCFFDDWHMYDWFYLAPYRESFGLQAQDGARLRFENSLLRRTAHLKDGFSTANDATRCETGGKIDTVNAVVTADSTVTLNFGVGCSGTTGWTRPYPVTLEVPDAVLRMRLVTLTGNQP